MMPAGAPDGRQDRMPTDADDADDTGGGDASVAAVTCAICYEDTTPNGESRVFRAPCCGTQSTASTTQFCVRCISTVVTMRGSGVGPCPRCRTPLKMGDDSGTFVVARAERACRVCRQPRATMDVCDACEYGARHRLRYECVECGHVQVIAHPMWRYCERPGSETTETWACHGRCGTFRRWRIVEADVRRVPPEDAPRTWGAEEEWFASVREEIARRREAARRQGGNGGGRRRATPNSEWVARIAFALFWVVVAILVVILPEGSGSRSSSSSSSLRSRSSSSTSSSSSSSLSSRSRPSRSARASVAPRYDDFGGANVSRT